MLWLQLSDDSTDDLVVDLAYVVVVVVDYDDYDDDALMLLSMYG